MPCPKKKWWQTWSWYCSKYPGCPGCISVSGGGYEYAGGNSLYVRLTSVGQWEQLTGDEIAAVKAQAAELETSLPADPVKRNLALAAFYAEQDLPLLRIQALDDALSAASEDVAAAAPIVIDLADALRTAGFYQAALETSDYVPQLLPASDRPNSMLLGQALQSKARSLDLLGRTVEADAVYATAQHVLMMAGQLRR